MCKFWSLMSLNSTICSSGPNLGLIELEFSTEVNFEVLILKYISRRKKQFLLSNLLIFNEPPSENGNNERSVFHILVSKDHLCISRKSHKVSRKNFRCFVVLQNPKRDVFGKIPPPPRPNKIKRKGSEKQELF